LLLVASDMNVFMKKNLLYVLALLILVAIGAFFAKRGSANQGGWHLSNGVQRGQNTQVMTDGKKDDGSMMQKDNTKNDNNAVMEEEMSMKDKGSSEEGVAMEEEKKEVSHDNHVHGEYIDYSPEKVAELGNKRGLLFFHASWCPSCRTADADIKKNLENIPEDLVIMNIDFDEYGDWGRENYMVRGQHSFVQIDGDGNMITSWSGGKFKDILRKIDE